MKIFFAAFLPALMLTVVSCSKKSDPDPASTQTKTDLITASAWKVNDVGLDPDKNGTIDLSLLSQVAACQADNTILFKKDNTGVTDESTMKCNTSDPQTTTFNWSFADAEANINVSNSILTSINGKSKLVELTALSLTLSKDTTISGLGATTVVVKLKH